MSSNNPNQLIARRLQTVLKEHGVELKLGHAYEVLSKLAGHASFNVASAKNADLNAILANVSPVESDAVNATQPGMPAFEVKVKIGNASKTGEMEIKKYYRVSADNEDQAKRIVEEYLSIREGDIDAEAARYPQTRLLLRIESERDYESKNWEVTSLPLTSSHPYVEQVYPAQAVDRIAHVLQRGFPVETKLAAPVVRELESRKAKKATGLPNLSPGKWCYAIIPDQVDENGYIPSVVIENESGHRPMRGAPGGQPYYWGKTEEEAEETCARANERLGISKERAQEIVISSMRTQNEEKDFGAKVRKELSKSTIPVARTRRGKTVLDVSECPMTDEGDYFLTDFQEGVDYCVGDPNTKGSKHIWTIGKNKKTGEIFASTTGRYYENPEFECLFLR